MPCRTLGDLRCRQRSLKILGVCCPRCEQSRSALKTFSSLYNYILLLRVRLHLTHSTKASGIFTYQCGRRRHAILSALSCSEDIFGRKLYPLRKLAHGKNDFPAQEHCVGGLYFCENFLYPTFFLFLSIFYLLSASNHLETRRWSHLLAENLRSCWEFGI